MVTLGALKTPEPSEINAEMSTLVPGFVLLGLASMLEIVGALQSFEVRVTLAKSKS